MSPSTDYDGYLIKTNNDGNPLFVKSYNPGNCQVHFNDIQLTTDNGFILTGVSESWALLRKDIYLVKTNNLGDTIWTKSMGQNFKDQYAKSVQQTSDGGYILTGFTNLNNDINGDVFLLKTDHLGDTIWVKTFGGTKTDIGESVQQTFDGGYIISGHTESYGSGNQDVFLIKTDSEGDTLWTRTYGGENNDLGYSVETITNEGYIISGTTSSFGNGDFDAYFIKTDLNGDTLWTRTYGGSNEDKCNSIQHTTDGGFIASGSTNSYGNKFQFYLIKIDENGNISGILEKPSINPNRKIIKTIDFLGKEINPQINIPYIEVYDDGSTEKKIILN